MNTTEERLVDALRSVGDTVSPEDVPPPRFTERRRAGARRPVLIAAAAAAAVIAGGAVAGGVLPSGHKDRRPVAASTGVRVALFLCTRQNRNDNCAGRDVTERQKADLNASLDTDRRVRDVVYVTKERHWEQFRARFKNTRPPALPTTSPESIPPMFIATVGRADVKAFMQFYLGRPGVDTVVIEGR
ncbi:permease-like cell division protein FtsX [Actinomadura violacea]|uniref:Permease-like cell division protein FtsX n=1 Tax=Actinomadura violacea TaxID=2819934 RepID=A0ABS3RI36_9ACTN|nr:permease-like cell division protein FtsX [Actinomadura violacea]MBO2456386.1 permease-like cell division protein FtsX [Actinomadura violacea]